MKELLGFYVACAVLFGVAWAIATAIQAVIT